MKYIFYLPLILITFLSFSSNDNEVKTIESYKIVESILKQDKILMNRISCQSKNDNYCSLELDGSDFMVDCFCEGYSLKLEPNIKELTEWSHEEKVKIMTTGHNYFKNHSSFNISYIEILKIEGQVYVYAQLLEKHMNNRILFTIDK